MLIYLRGFDASTGDWEMAGMATSGYGSEWLRPAPKALCGMV